MLCYHHHSSSLNVQKAFRCIVSKIDDFVSRNRIRQFIANVVFDNKAIWLINRLFIIFMRYLFMPADSWSFGQFETAKLMTNGQWSYQLHNWLYFILLLSMLPDECMRLLQTMENLLSSSHYLEYLKHLTFYILQFNWWQTKWLLSIKLITAYIVSHAMCKATEPNENIKISNK